MYHIFVCTNDNLFCAKDVVVENVLYHTVVEIVLARTSEVFLNRDTYESHEIIFCNKLESDVSCWCFD